MDATKTLVRFKKEQLEKQKDQLDKWKWWQKLELSTSTGYNLYIHTIHPKKIYKNNKRLEIYI